MAIVTDSFLPCFEARSASWRARRSAFSSALLLAALSEGVEESTWTLTGLEPAKATVRQKSMWNFNREYQCKQLYIKQVY